MRHESFIGSILCSCSLARLRGKDWPPFLFLHALSRSWKRQTFMSITEYVELFVTLGHKAIGLNTSCEIAVARQFHSRQYRTGWFGPATNFLRVSSLFLVPCAAGTYAKTGAEPCTPCAKGYYQPFEKQTYCLRCGDTKSTYGLGASTAAQCVGMYRWMSLMIGDQAITHC